MRRNAECCRCRHVGLCCQCGYRPSGAGIIDGPNIYRIVPAGIKNVIEITSSCKMQFRVYNLLETIYRHAMVCYAAACGERLLAVLMSQGGVLREQRHSSSADAGVHNAQRGPN